jgi:hypothetical protein
MGVKHVPFHVAADGMKLVAVAHGLIRWHGNIKIIHLIGNSCCRLASTAVGGTVLASIHILEEE